MRATFWLAISVVVATTTACAARSGPGEPSAPGESPAAAPTAATIAAPVPLAPVWQGGISLPAGNRSAIADGDTGWIVTQPIDDDGLLLTRLSLTDGVITTLILAEHVTFYTGSAIAVDDQGNVWIAYSQQVARADPITGHIDRWSLPVLTDLRDYPDAPTAGSADAAAWEPATQSLLLTRNGAHFLYRLDPRDGTVTAAADIGLVTDPTSIIRVALDGTIGVRGWSSAASAVAAAVLGSSRTDQWPGASSICTLSGQIGLLGPSGDVSLLSGGQALPVARIGALDNSSPPFACASDNAFVGTESGPQITVTRLGVDGKSADVALPLLSAGKGVGMNGKPLGPGWFGAGLQALIPDPSGGVWLVTLSGTRVNAADDDLYPSLLHVSFPAP